MKLLTPVLFLLCVYCENGQRQSRLELAGNGFGQKNAYHNHKRVAMITFFMENLNL